jgi:acrylyl-CoA reductase (NADPH)
MAQEDTFKAMVLTQEDDETRHEVKELTLDDLPEGDILVGIDYSSLNFKDAMAVTGAGPIVRSWPMVPGIDLAGTVEESDSPDYEPGDEVVLTGWGVGEEHWGGYAQKQRVNSEWLVPLPEGLDAKSAMALGTAGFTAMLCVLTLEDAGVAPDSGTVLVTGASGGVGSVAVSVLSALGYEVAALTSSEEDETQEYLRSLGASEIVGGPEWSEDPNPLEKQRWAGAVDTVGSSILARVLAETNYGGAVAACGMAAGTDLKTTVMPFILRAVSLLGVDSVSCPQHERKRAWERLAQDLPEDALGKITRDETSLEEVPRYAKEMLESGVRGRIVVAPYA